MGGAGRFQSVDSRLVREQPLELGDPLDVGGNSRLLAPVADPMDAPDTHPAMDWHQITACFDTTETWAMNVPGGALVRVSRSRRDTGSPNATIAEALTLVPGAVVAHRWRRDQTEVYVEVALIKPSLLGRQTETFVNNRPVMTEPPWVWVSADDDLPARPDAVESRSGAQRSADEIDREIAEMATNEGPSISEPITEDDVSPLVASATSGQQCYMAMMGFERGAAGYVHAINSLASKSGKRPSDVLAEMLAGITEETP
jgi:hypothetical protein